MVGLQQPVITRKTALRLRTGNLLLLFLLAGTASSSAAPSFYRDILPILRQRCQSCHRAGEMAPMPLETYGQTKPFATAIAQVTRNKSMPPWFADPCCGNFRNDPSLTQTELDTIATWVRNGAQPGDPREAPPAAQWVKGWNIETPDVVFNMPQPAAIPASGDVPYEYIIIPTSFQQDRWVRMTEIRPGSRAVVHHAVAYIRDPKSTWLRGAPVGVPFSADDLRDPALRHAAMFTTSDVLLVYAPGSPPDRWPDGFAKLVPAGSDIVLQMHYMAHGHATADRTSVGMVFSEEPPNRRVLTLQLNNDRFIIPPGDPDHRVEVHGTLPNDALLMSFFPHMHLRGKTFEYNILEPDGHARTLLRIPNYDFYWQLGYALSEPIPLKAGTVLQAVATFDNSRHNRHNPDPDSAVTWGEQTWAEMMIGFFDVAVDPGVDKEHFFVRPGKRLN